MTKSSEGKIDWSEFYKEAVKPVEMDYTKSKDSEFVTDNLEGKPGFVTESSEWDECAPYPVRKKKQTSRGISPSRMEGRKAGFYYLWEIGNIHKYPVSQMKFQIPRNPYKAQKWSKDFEHMRQAKIDAWDRGFKEIVNEFESADPWKHLVTRIKLEQETNLLISRPILFLQEHTRIKCVKCYARTPIKEIEIVDEEEKLRRVQCEWCGGAWIVDSLYQPHILSEDDIRNYVALYEIMRFDETQSSLVNDDRLMEFDQVVEAVHHWGEKIEFQSWCGEEKPDREDDDSEEEEYYEEEEEEYNFEEE